MEGVGLRVKNEGWGVKMGKVKFICKYIIVGMKGDIRIILKGAILFFK